MAAAKSICFSRVVRETVPFLRSNGALGIGLYRCGARAANELDGFIASRVVSCLPINLDRYEQTVATCSVGGADLGKWLGLALDWPQYSKGRYDAVQRAAGQAGQGMWQQLLNLGSIGRAFAPGAARPAARMTRTLTQ
jgi:endonuclease YncB( thermonuclease family)